METFVWVTIGTAKLLLWIYRYKATVCVDATMLRNNNKNVDLPADKLHSFEIVMILKYIYQY